MPEKCTSDGHPRSCSSRSCNLRLQYAYIRLEFSPFAGSPNTSSKEDFMPAVNLVPLSLGELLDQTFSYLRKHFWLFAGIMVAPEALLVGFNILMQIFFKMPQPLPGTRAPAPAQMAAYAIRAGLSTLAILLSYYIVYALALGATTHALSEIHLGRTTTIRESYRAVRRRLGRLINVTLTIVIRTFGVFALAVFVLAFSVAFMGSIPKSLAWLALILGLGLFVGFLITGILLVIFLVRYSVAVPALVLENLSARQALKRSVSLTKGYLWRLLVVGVLMLLIRAVVVFLCQAPFTIVAMLMVFKGARPSVWITIPSMLVGGACGAATTPLFMIGFALAYYDLRVRKEGFDLQLMMAHLDETLPQGAPAGQQSEDVAPLADAGVFAMCLLTLVTAGLYQPIWFLSRRKALNNLHSQEKLGVWPLVMALAALLASLCLPIIGSFKWGSWVETENTIPPLHPLILLLVAGVILIVQSFKVRRILLDHLAPREGGMFSAGIRMQHEESVSRTETFFFGIFYLQHKINGMLDRFLSDAGNSGETNSRAPSPLPVPPVIP